MTTWAWALLIVVARSFGAPATETLEVAGRSRLDLSWTSPDLPAALREGVTRGVQSGSRERALILGQAAIDLDLASLRDVHAASVWLLLRGIPSLSVPETTSTLEGEARRVLGELARRLPSRLVRDFRETLGVLELPAGEHGRVSPRARELVVAFFTGTARGLGATR
jgi:hypothetical protein